MAKMIPELTDAALDALPSHAEAVVYRAARDQLPPNILVLHSLHILDAKMREGEADFLFLDPEFGALVVEVKGGGVTFDPRTNEWKSTNREGIHDIKDPFRQAADRMHAVVGKLQDTPRFRKAVGGRITAGYAAIFPELSATQVRLINRPDTRPELCGSGQDVNALKPWLRRAFELWRKGDEVKLGQVGVATVEGILCSVINVRPLVSAKLRDEEVVRKRLTDEQARILAFIEGRERVGIHGGAGTGKTLIAIEHARALARAGKRVLMLCYNRALADHLKDVCEADGLISPMTFHQLCEWWASSVSSQSGRNILREADAQYPGSSRTEVQLPQALLIALDDFAPPPFDAVIVDEGQDFLDDDWLTVGTLIDKTHAHFAVFYDHNQRLYRRSEYLPIQDDRELFALTRNCRNTKTIHEEAARRYDGPDYKPPAIEGVPTELLVSQTIAAQARRILEGVRGLLAEEVPPEEIAVLLLAADGLKASFYEALGRSDPSARCHWAYETHRQPGTILVDTVVRFKGLERAVIFLWIGPELDEKLHREQLYVGASRAKSRLVLVGSEVTVGLLGAPP